MIVLKKVILNHGQHNHTHDHVLQSRLKVAMLDNLLNVYSIIIVIIVACIGLGLSLLHR